MALFNYNPSDSIDYTKLTTKLEKQPKIQSRATSKPRGTNDLSKNFYIFQIQPDGAANAALDLSKVTPVFNGGVDAPDILMQLEMLCFNLAKSEKVNSKTRATMRVIIQQMETLDASLDPLVWVVSAGLQLYNLKERKRSKPIDLKMDFRETFGKRPIEIPRGRAMMTFDVYKHKAPGWWHKVFKFLRSNTGKTLTSAVGFPGVTQEAVGIIDELLNRLSRNKTETLFQSVPLELVMHEAAKKLREADGITKAGCLNPGLFVLCQGGDLRFFKDTPATYFSQQGILVPQGTEPAEFLSADFQNPFDDKTYSIFRVGMQPTKLKPQMIFGVELPHVT